MRVDLEPLFSPDSVAVVGASPDSWYSSRLVENLTEYGYDGDLYLVNPSRDSAFDRGCYDSVSELPETVDLVVVSVPREAAVDVVEEAGGEDIPAALVITAGFGEADEEGRELEEHLGEVADEHGIRVCGPNSIGLADSSSGTVLTSTCSRRPVEGNVALVSQSGALAFTTFYERGKDEDVDFSFVVSTGNEADLTVADYVEYAASREDVEVVCVYVEGVERPRELMRAADEATRDGTSVLAVKVGRSGAGDAAAVSHTGSVTGNDDAWEAAFRQAGVERVEDVPDLLSRASVHAEFDTDIGGREVCVASTSGGLASLLADMADERGLELPPLSDSVEKELLENRELLTFGGMNNPADIRGYGADHLREIADVLFRDDYDAYVFAVGLSAVDERAESIADDLSYVVNESEVPVLVLWTGRKEADEGDGEKPYERLRSEVPVFYDPSRCIEALASLVNYSEYRSGSETKHSYSELGASSKREFDLRGDGWESDSRLLDEYGVGTVRTRVCADADEAVDAADELGYPVVVKVDSPGVPHRTEADAVRTRVSEGEVGEAFDEVTENARSYSPGASVNRVLVQEHVEGVEAFVGVSHDDVFGPLVTVGYGGEFVELLDEKAVLVPPFSERDVRDALDSTVLGDIDGHRGKRYDVGSFVELVKRVGDLAYEVENVEEVDLNPVILTERDVHVVDVLVR